MKIYRVEDPRFKKYGSIIEGYDFSQLIKAMQEKPIPQSVEYMASDPKLEALPIFHQFSEGFWGDMPVELGYCMGHNQKLNALEFHRSSEVNIASTDYIVLLGLLQDVDEHYNYDTSNVEAFYVSAGTAVEFFATTLHYCACHVQEQGYSHATFLPKGTNCPLPAGFVPRTEADHLLAARNKWMLVHPQGGLDANLPAKLTGENCEIRREDWKAVE